MYEIGTVYLLIAVALILGDWRRGLPIVVLTTIIQDPLRKLTPDQPIAFSLMAGVLGVVTLLASIGRSRADPPWRFNRNDYRTLALPGVVFIAIIVLQSINGFLSHGSVFAVALGVLTYLGPLPAILVGRHLAQTSGDRAALGFLKVYLVLAIPAAYTVFLQYSGVDWPIFGEVGQGLHIYDVILNGAPVVTFSGVFRSSEIAAWHIAACCCFFTIVATQRNVGALNLLICVVVVGALLALGVVTGRRKLLVQVTVFLAAYVFLVAFIGRIGLKMWLAVGVATISVWLIATSLENVVMPDSTYRQFLVRGQTGFYGVGDRFSKLGMEPLFWAYDRFGPAGGGVGAATSGAQNYGVDATMVAVGEGGLGKLAGELGWPGLAAAIWLGIAVAGYVLKTTGRVALRSPQDGRLRCGMAAFLFANIGAFSVATQVFNDLFVLTTLGLFVGTLLSQSSIASVRFGRSQSVPRGRKTLQGA